MLNKQKKPYKGENMKNRVIKIIITISIIIILLDQISKIIVLKFLSNSVGNDYFGMELVLNTGMAFGFNNGNTRNVFLTVFVLLIIFNFIKNQIERIDTKTSIALGLVIGGGTSNLIDRFVRKGVIDFIKLFKIPNFNIADICVVIGWILIIVFLIDYSKKK